MKAHSTWNGISGEPVQNAAEPAVWVISIRAR